MKKNLNPLKVSGEFNGKKLLIALAVTFAGSLIAGLFSMNSRLVYSKLQMPSFSPPSSVFMPVWTILYILLAIAFYRILMQPATAERRKAVFYYILQLLFNILWPVLFFALGLRLAALIDLVILIVYALLATVSFFRLDKAAGVLMLPYLIWLAYAALLNAAIFALNG